MGSRTFLRAIAGNVFRTPRGHAPCGKQHGRRRKQHHALPARLRQRLHTLLLHLPLHRHLYAGAVPFQQAQQEISMAHRARRTAVHRLCTALCFVNWQATLVVFILPFLAFRLVAMAGNWVQHTFICPEQPGNDYRNSITCINVKFNHKCWNDGYHISHHINPTLHWTEHPKYFREHLAKFAENRSVVFAGLNFLDIFVMLMKDDYEKMASHYVNVGDVFKSDEEVIAHLRSRVVPIPFAVPTGNVAYAV
ncbi:MAG: fatty acid desaturase [Flavobacteriales bacterium]|nr:fatty acid desaturase [Flavobacteriales bacterium]